MGQTADPGRREEAIHWSTRAFPEERPRRNRAELNGLCLTAERSHVFTQPFRLVVLLKTPLRLITLAAVVAVGASTAPAAAAPVVEPCNVTALPGSGGVGNAINSSGEVAGSRQAPDGQSVAVVWDRNGVATELSRLPGSSYNVAYDINNAGQAVGEAIVVNPENFLGYRHAVVWDKRGAITDLGFLPQGDQATAVAINNRGVIAGSASGPPRMSPWGELMSGPDFAVIWTPTVNGGYTVERLANLPNTITSQATDINNAGQLVGEALTEDENGVVGHAVTWDSQGNITELPMLPGATWPKATSINNRGEIVGFVQMGPNVQAVVWTPLSGGGYTITELGGLGGGSTVANDINDAGVIVGRATLANGQVRAVVWTPTPGGGYTITALCPLPGDTFSEGNAINNRTQVAGRSIGNDVHRAVRFDT